MNRLIPSRLIDKKRRGEELTSEELEGLFLGFLSGEIPDYQMSAFLMAVWFRGMTADETAHLTGAMLRSGEANARFEKIVLVHGVRYAADLSYQERIAEISDGIDGKITYIPVISREKSQNALHGRITHLIENGDLELETPERCQWLRVLAGEIARVSDHLTRCGAAALELIPLLA